MGQAPVAPPAPGERTLLEAEVGDPLNGCVSVLHELVEADEEGFLLLLLPAARCLFHRLLLGAIPSDRSLLRDTVMRRGN